MLFTGSLGYLKSFSPVSPSIPFRKFWAADDFTNVYLASDSEQYRYGKQSPAGPKRNAKEPAIVKSRAFICIFGILHLEGGYEGGRDW